MEYEITNIEKIEDGKLKVDFSVILPDGKEYSNQIIYGNVMANKGTWKMHLEKFIQRVADNSIAVDDNISQYIGKHEIAEKKPERENKNKNPEDSHVEEFFQNKKNKVIQ